MLLSPHTIRAHSFLNAIRSRIGGQGATLGSERVIILCEVRQPTILAIGFLVEAGFQECVK